VPNVLVGDEYKLYTITTRSGPVQVATAPYPMRAGLLTDKETHSLTISEIDDRMRAALQLVLRDLARQAAQSNAPPSYTRMRQSAWLSCVPKPLTCCLRATSWQ
jgi:hypothetical protein